MEATLGIARRQPTFRQDLSSLFDRNLHKLFLTWPILGVLLFTIVPLIFMSGIAGALFYDQASQLDNSSVYHHLHALAAALDGQVAVAAEIWNIIANDRRDTLHTVAALHLTYLKTRESSRDSASSILQTANASSGADVETEASGDVNSQTEQKPIFTVQVGAFGSKANADNLVRRLTAESHRDITVVTAASGGQTLYRVRVGAFQRREEADAFAGKLSGTGMSPRVVEK